MGRIRAGVWGVVVGIAAAGAAPALVHAGGAQAGAPELYRCEDETGTDAPNVGAALCDAEPTEALAARAEPDNLQIRAGALVADVEATGIAAGAGLAAGDVIYRVGGIDVDDARAAVERLAGIGATADTVVNFLRRGRPYRVKIRQ